MSKYTRCPECKREGAKTIDSRPSLFLHQITTRRRHHCTLCNYRWTTFEVSGEMIALFDKCNKQLQELRKNRDRITALLGDG